nr:putative ribonuclease H-like domain-containing protein [Tanacetum cinerariifolium]
MVQQSVRNHAIRGNHHHYERMTNPNPHRHVVPTTVLTRSRLVPLNAARPITTVVLLTKVHHQRPTTHGVPKIHSQSRRTIKLRPLPTHSNFHQKVTTILATQVNVVQGVKGNWVWKPKCHVLYHVSRHTSASMTLKLFDYTDALGRSKEISYLSDFEEINGEYVAFGENPKCGKITGLEYVEAILVIYQQNETVFEEDIKLLKLDVMLRDNALNLSHLLASQTTDKTGLGYDNQVFNSTVFDCDEMFSFEPDVSMPASLVYDRPSAPIIKDWVSDSEDESKGVPMPTQKAQSFVQTLEHLKTPRPSIKPDYDYYEKKMVQQSVRNHAIRGNHQHYERMTHPNPHRHVVPTTVLTRYRLVPLNAARPITTVVLLTKVHHQKPTTHGVPKIHSQSRRTINLRPLPTHSDFHQKVTTVQATQVNVVQGVKGNWEISYLSDFEEIIGEYVAFGGNPKGGKITVKEHKSAVHVSLSRCEKTKKHDDKTTRKAKGKSPVELSTRVRNLREEFEDFSNNSINWDNDASTPVTTVGQNSTNNTNTFSAACPSNTDVSLTLGKSLYVDPFQYPDDPDMPALEDITYSDNEEDVGVEDDFSNLETNITISPIPTTRVYKDHYVSQIIEEPKRVHQDLKDPNWIEAMQEELLQFKMKKEEGIDYEEVFSLVSRIEAIRNIEEEVYVCQPPGFKDPDYPDKVYKVVKAIYGLHQAPRAWYETLANYLLENGFQRDKIDQTLFIKEQKGDILLVQVYVDDIIFVSTNKDLCKAFEKLMKDKFQMSSMGELTFFLGLQVKQKQDGIFISQDKYVAEILRKFGLTDGKSASTVIDKEKPLLKDPNGKDVDVHTYRLMIVTPKASHLHAIKRIFRYLKGTPHLGLWYPKDSPFNLVAYSDSDYAGASLDRNSTIGGCQFLGVNKPRCDEDRLEIIELKTNDVVRLQALIDRRKVIITKDTVRQALQLDDVDSIDCLPNEEIFAHLVRNVDSSSKFYMYPRFLQLMINAEGGYSLFEGILVPQQVINDVADDVTDHVVDVVADAAEPTPPSPTTTPPPLEQELIPSTTHCMSAKRTTWNELSSSMALAVICLSTEAIRLFLAYASFMGFMVYQMDVKSTFFYRNIEEEVYVCQPPGFKDPDYPDKVYKVVKAIYGLHQAPRAWYKTLANYLLENGFQRDKIDQTLFIKKQKGNILLVQVYVDDIIFVSTNKDLCKAFEKLMKDKFQMSSMGELTFFLGLKVKQKQDGIFISQDKYVAEILRKFGLTDGKLASTVIDKEKPLLKDPNGKDVDVYTYRLIIGSLMYLTSSRLDIMYLKGTPHLGLWYPKDSPFNLVAYSDSDYAGASLDRNSTIGGCQFLGCRLISWQCKKQTVVATSSTETKDVAAAIRHHFIRDYNDKKLIQVVKIPSDNNFADLLTKAFDVGRFQYLVALNDDVADDVTDHVVDVVADAAEPTPPLPTTTPPPLEQELIPSTSHVAHTQPPSPHQSPIAQPSSPPKPQPSLTLEISMDLLNTLFKTCTTLTKKVENLEHDKIAQALEITMLKRMHLNKGKIAKTDADKDVTIEEVAAEVIKDADVHERLEESRAQVYRLDLEHAQKIEVVIAASTTTAATIITVAPMPMASAASRRNGVVIGDLEEIATPSVVAHSEPKSKDKGKGILVKRKEKQDNTVMRYQALKRKLQTKAHARKNIMVYVNNMARFKMDFFKEKRRRVRRRGKQAKQEENETSKEKEAKKQKLDEEVEELKTHLQIVPNDEDDVYTETIPLALKIPVVGYQIHIEDNKPFYKIISADGTHQLFLSFISLLKNFDREDLEIYGLAKVKSWKLLESWGVHIITFTTTQMILLVEERYPLTRFTLNQMLNNARVKSLNTSSTMIKLVKLKILDVKLDFKAYTLRDYYCWLKTYCCLARKNELKARGTLLMALQDKHQLKFNIHKDAKSLMDAIEKRFGGNKKTNKSNSLQLDTDDLKQIDADDLKEMDLKWQMAILTMRARRTTGIRRLKGNVPVETSNSKALVSQCYDNQVFNSNVFDCDEMFSFESNVSMPTSPVYDWYKSGERYHVVPPLYTGTFMPPKPDLVFHDAPTVNETVHSILNVEPSPTMPNTDFSQSNRPSAPIIKDWVSDSEEESEGVPMPTQKVPSFVQTPKHVKTPRPFIKPVEHPIPADNLRKDIPKSRGHKHSWNRKACFVCKSLTHLIKDCDYYDKKWHVIPTTVFTRSRLVPLNAARHVTSAIPLTKVHHQRPTKHWQPQHAFKDKGIIDNGCSQHMTENISYLFDIEEINREYVAFGGNPKGGKITDTECIVLSSNFKLLDDNHLLLRFPRENNMYNVNLKNIVLLGDLTCLFAKATLDDSNLWHRRLGYIYFKTMNKLVK